MNWVRTLVKVAACAFLAISPIVGQAQQTPVDNTAQSMPQSDAAPLPDVARPMTRAQQLQPSPARSLDEVVDRTIASERRFLENLRKSAPLIETYIQRVHTDTDVGVSPQNDFYYLGRLELTTNGTKDISYLPKPGIFSRMMKQISHIYALDFLPLGFAQMALIDNSKFDRQHYNFKYVHREFLGDTRCIVLDVSPRKGAGSGRFLGRIWVEDQEFNIVRFNGAYTGEPMIRQHHLHFDSWRLNLQPGVWLPAYIYSEESELPYRENTAHAKYKAMTRLWGYELHHASANSEFSDVLVEGPNVRDPQSARDLGPVEAQRQWERQSENNALNRLQRAGLIAPPGEVDNILQTVVNNLEITNKLEIVPDVRCRVLLTTPLESFHIGHTIVLSRGLVDVLPDEATLAAVLAHELAHIVLGHKSDTRYGFLDRTLFRDEDTYRKMNFRHNAQDENAADQKAVELLQNSPYKDKLQSVGLFTRALQVRQKALPNLIRGRLGNTLLVDGSRVRMQQLETNSPELKPRDLAQLPALPLGSRVRMDPWSDQIELIKGKPVALLNPAEKLLFEVTPVYPYVTRYKGGMNAEKAADAAPTASR
jgi:hypothetical protein